ncbi:unnamed protein product [Rotaria sp. Silwood2]|nr:unnamed protein product [Rotaria sp. Silwood2]CAF3052395.1 unnamed protein product [Rotaria sp. Silwood2]CAF4262650.1 unnamed protein product [Rotaria sp. Silwood2]CAF4391888.1 unnamed protein product [Rotaria sp. Silwood2]
MNSTIIFMILIISITLVVNTVATRCSTQAGCFGGTTIACCKGHILQVINETTAKCIRCLASGALCYNTKKECCPGYHCGVGGVVLATPQPGARCVSNLIDG